MSVWHPFIRWQRFTMTMVMMVIMVVIVMVTATMAVVMVMVMMVMIMMVMMFAMAVVMGIFFSTSLFIINLLGAYVGQLTIIRKHILLFILFLNPPHLWVLNPIS